MNHAPPRPFGRTAAGALVEAVDLAGGSLRATVLTLGASLQDLRLAGADWPLILGAGAVPAYEGALRYAGAIVGPVANRIAGASIRIGGQDHRLDPNEAGRTTLHGGATGTHLQIWRIAASGPDRVTMVLRLPDGLGGFPGNRTLVAEYRIVPPARLALGLYAVTDAPTPVNLASHGYWNLDGRGDVSGHRLRIAADHLTPVDAAKIPTGEIAPVAGSGFDFRGGQGLGGALRIDHNFCLNGTGPGLRPAAELRGASGLRMRIATTAPGLQVYDGAHLSLPAPSGLDGRGYGSFAGVALEPQHWPDAPNHPGFPPILLAPGGHYRQETTFDFDTAP